MKKIKKVTDKILDFIMLVMLVVILALPIVSFVALGYISFVVVNVYFVDATTNELALEILKLSPDIQKMVIAGAYALALTPLLIFNSMAQKAME